jgi:hypothetical protein
LGRRKKSSEKDVRKKSIDKEKEVVSVKTYGLKEDISNLAYMTAD